MACVYTQCTFVFLLWHNYNNDLCGIIIHLQPVPITWMGWYTVTVTRGTLSTLNLVAWSALFAHVRWACTLHTTTTGTIHCNTGFIYTERQHPLCPGTMPWGAIMWTRWTIPRCCYLLSQVQTKWVVLVVWISGWSTASNWFEGLLTVSAISLCIVVTCDTDIFTILLIFWIFS